MKVLIADDHPLVREALRKVLSGRSSEFEVVGEAADGLEAVEVCRRTRPDLVLMDIRMPKMDGLAATRAIKREFPRTVVLIVTVSSAPYQLFEALKAGAAGYVLKYATAKEITDAIRGIFRGEHPLDEALSKQLLLRLVDETKEEKFASPIPPSRPPEEHSRPTNLELLTPKEMDVLRLLAQGQTNKEIAKNLLVSVNAVKTHVHQILVKLEVSDRTQAAVKAIKLGLLHS